MNPHDRVRLRHALDALNAAMRFVEGRTRGDLDTDEMLLFAAGGYVGIEIGHGAFGLALTDSGLHGHIGSSFF
jgi:hypothetical protein